MLHFDYGYVQFSTVAFIRYVLKSVSSHANLGESMEWKREMRKTVFCFALIALTLSITAASVPFIGIVKATSGNAGSTGLTAAVIATTGQVITGTVNAIGFDIGVYVGPGITGVVIKKAIITGANDHGILILDTSDIVVKDSVISGNGVSRHSGIPEDKAINLVGTTDVLVKDNTVSFNLADGGISVTDDGPINPAALPLHPGSPNPAKGNVITGNTVKDNNGGCGIVVAAYNTGEGVADNVVKDNTVIGNSPPYATFPPYIGGIVVAADAPFTTAKNNLVIRNTVEGGWIPGIIVHSNALGDFVTGTKIIHNKLDSNGFFPGSTNDATKPTGINIVAEVSGGSNPSVLTNTLVIWNTVTNDYYGVWHLHDTNTLIIHLQGSAAVPIAP